jgi:small-conductance mechanosensitive channel
MNNEVVTIPNSIMMSSNIVNYNTIEREFNDFLIIATTITLGYDVPWQKVHQTLINAALTTTNILKNPTPFVWQTSLNDYNVSYQLKAYTNQPSKIYNTYSELHQNIQDKCNEAEIEILSPQYTSLRDGNHNTIPEDYLPENYTAPGFRVHPLKDLFDQKP